MPALKHRSYDGSVKYAAKLLVNKTFTKISVRKVEGLRGESGRQSQSGAAGSRYIAPRESPNPVASMSEASWYLYLIECADGALYTGIALDPAARYALHRAGKGAKYTRANRPVRLIGVIPYPDRGSATRAEIAFKKLKAAEKRARLGEFAAVTA